MQDDCKEIIQLYEFIFLLIAVFFFFLVLPQIKCKYLLLSLDRIRCPAISGNQHHFFCSSGIKKAIGQILILVLLVLGKYFTLRYALLCLFPIVLLQFIGKSFDS